MKLRIFSLIVLFLILLTGFSFIIFISYSVIDNTTRQLEEEEVVSLLNKATIALSYLQKELSYLTIDWAEWDDTYELIQDSSYKTLLDYDLNNLNLHSLDNLNIDLVMIQNLDGEVILARALNVDADGFDLIPERFLSIGRNKELFVDLSLENTKGRTGIVHLSHGYAMISWHPVVPSNLNGDPVGVLIFGRYLDEDVLSDLADIIGNPISLQDTVNFTDYPSTDIVTNLRDNPYDWMIRSDNTLFGYTTIQDITNDSSLFIGVQTSSEYIYQQRNIQLLVFIALVVLSLIFFVVSFSYLDHRILIRIQSIINQVKTISSGVYKLGEQPIQMDGNDEIAFLADEINQMITGLELSKKELLDSEALKWKIIDNMPEYVIIYGNNKKIFYANQKSCPDLIS